MKKNSAKWFFILLSVSLLLISCTGTELTQKKMDDTYKGTVSNILVIALTGNEHYQRSFEKTFVAQLKSAGVNAIASKEVMPLPADLELKKETILDTVNQHKNDAVIITRLVSMDEKDVYNRRSSGYPGYYEYYRAGYGYLHGPGYSSTSTKVYLETNLYDVKTERLIWSGQSKTLSRDPKDSQIINEVIKVLIRDLQKSKLIPPK